MSNTEGITSTIEQAPDDGEPPSLGSKRSWQSAWQVNPFAVDTDYVHGVNNLELLSGRTEEDKMRDREALAVIAVRNTEVERDYFDPRPKEPKAVTGPQRIMLGIRKALTAKSKVA